MKKLICLVCNAHIDPVWQWLWEEGAAETLSTFRVAAELCEQDECFVFNHNEALLYRWVEEYDPSLFDKIKSLVAQGKWHIMGGWYLQPDCNMPSGEALVRQITYGRRYFFDKFGKVPNTAINFDPFGHSRGLVQIMKKSGYDSYIICRPGKKFLELPGEVFRWSGYDGSEIIVHRAEYYNSEYGKATVKISDIIDKCPENGVDLCLWGVGDHGGGPSKLDLKNIDAMIKKKKCEGVEIKHSTPEYYFNCIHGMHDKLPIYADSLNPWSPGCYTSQIEIKMLYRALENEYFMSEKMVSAASMLGLMPYTRNELEEALCDLLNAQFHDQLPGTMIESAEKATFSLISHGREILSRIRAKSFFALSAGEKPAKSGTIPILIYNPYPYPIKDDFDCEMTLWKQNWENNWSKPTVYNGNTKLPTQCEKEESNLSLDWRKRVVFNAVLKPMTINRFDCKYEKVFQKPFASADKVNDCFIFNNGYLSAAVDCKTGLLSYCQINGENYLDENAFSLNVMDDDGDPWGMLVTKFNNKLAAFSLLNKEEAMEYCGYSSLIPSVRVIESGEVRTVVEAVFGYNCSRAVMRYTFSNALNDIQIDLRIKWSELKKILKLSVPVSFKVDACMGETAYGEDLLPQNGRENVSQKYIVMSGAKKAVAMINNGVYGSSCIENQLLISLLRSPVYTAHPIEGRPLTVEDRYLQHIDQGEHEFHFKLLAGDKQSVREAVVNSAYLFNEKPYVLSFFPSGNGVLHDSVIKLDNQLVRLTALKKADDGDGYIVRLFNTTDTSQQTTFECAPFGIVVDLLLYKYEILSLRIKQNIIQKCDLNEHTIE